MVNEGASEAKPFTINNLPFTILNSDLFGLGLYPNNLNDLGFTKYVYTDPDSLLSAY